MKGSPKKRKEHFNKIMQDSSINVIDSALLSLEGYLFAYEKDIPEDRINDLLEIIHIVRPHFEEVKGYFSEFKF